MSAARRTQISITWETIEISRDIGPMLTGLTYTDNLTGSADDLALELEDRDGLWSGSWRPVFGDTVEARVKVEAADSWLTGVTDLRLGIYAHDKITLSGPPKKATVKAVSAPMATGLRRRKRTRAWDSVTLHQIAEDIADRAGLALDWSGSDGRPYKRREQKNKSDLEFLDEAVKEQGRALKVTEGAIVIFSEESRDASASVGEINLVGGKVLGWNFDSDDSARYGNCHLKIFDPRSGKTIEGQFPAVGATPDAYASLGLDPDGQTLEVLLPVEDAAHAVDICKGKLRNANRFANSGHLVTVGDLGLVAGVTFDLTGADAFNGKFIVTRVAHQFVGGHTCALDVRRCVEGF